MHLQKRLDSYVHDRSSNILLECADPDKLQGFGRTSAGASRTAVRVEAAAGAPYGGGILNAEKNFETEPKVLCKKKSWLRP